VPPPWCFPWRACLAAAGRACLAWAVTRPHLLLDNLVKRYGAAKAVDGVSLPVERGECIALLGPSGCGKTTTLRLVAGFITPDSGRIMLDGQAIERAAPHRRPIGMVFQAYALFPHLTAAGNIGFGLEMRNLPRAERDQRVAEALAMVGLSLRSRSRSWSAESSPC